MRVTEDDLAEFIERRRHHWAGESMNHDADAPVQARSAKARG
jgi:hypothetical protein